MVAFKASRNQVRHVKLFSSLHLSRGLGDWPMTRACMSRRGQEKGCLNNSSLAWLLACTAN